VGPDHGVRAEVSGYLEPTGGRQRWCPWEFGNHGDFGYGFYWLVPLPLSLSSRVPRVCCTLALTRVVVQGATAGAIVVRWNIHESSQGSAAIWDAHVRVGGAKGSNLQYNDCPWSEAIVNTNCIAATLLFHITSTASAYMENVWIWTADHDLVSLLIPLHRGGKKKPAVVLTRLGHSLPSPSLRLHGSSLLGRVPRPGLALGHRAGTLDAVSIPLLPCRERLRRHPPDRDALLPTSTKGPRALHRGLCPTR